MAKAPTLKTISDLSGFAVPTVSRALSNAPDIRLETREKVQQIAREIGYRPNREGLRLKTGKTHTVSLVLGIVDNVSDHAGMLIASVARNLRDTPYTLLVTPFSSEQDDPLGAVKHVVESRLADAIIIEQIEAEDPRVRYMLDQDFPFACFGRGRWIEDCPYFDYDNAHFGRLAAKGLIDKGRRQIAMIAPPVKQSYAQELITAARHQIDAAGGSLRLIEGLHSVKSREETYQALRGDLAAHGVPEGIICCSTTDTMMVLRALREVGAEPGRDVDVFTKENIAQVQDIHPAVMSMVEDVEAAGAFLAKAVIAAMEQPGTAPMQQIAKAVVNRPTPWPTP